MATGNGHYECMNCESKSKPTKKNGQEICRKCGAPWDEAIWVENYDDEYEE